MKRTTAVSALVLSVACGSSRDPDFYALYPQPGQSAAAEKLRVELRRPGIPGYLERPHIVRRFEAGRLELAGNDRWGSTLEDLVSTTLAKNLSQRLPHSTVFTEMGSISARPDVVVELEIQRFELTEKDVVELVAQVAVHRPDSTDSRVERFELHGEPKNHRTPALVAEMSGLLAELADAIAELVAQHHRAEG